MQDHAGALTTQTKECYYGYLSKNGTTSYPISYNGVPWNKRVSLSYLYPLLHISQQLIWLEANVQQIPRKRHSFGQR